MGCNRETVLSAVLENRLRIFTTDDIGTFTGFDPSEVSRSLRNLASAGFLEKLKRGVWASRLGADIHPFEAVPYLRAPWPSYVSLYSALSEHGLIEEVPQVVYAATSAAPKRYATPIGAYRFHHLPERLVWGFQVVPAGRGSYPIAEPEKAFLDQVYLGTIPRSRVALPFKRGGKWKLDDKKLRAYAKRFESGAVVEYLRKEGLW